MAVKAFNGLLLALSLGLLYWISRMITGDRVISLAASLMVLFNSHFLRSSTIMMSEIPFFFVSLLAIFLFLRLDFAKGPLKSPAFAIFVVFLALNFYIRTAGIALFGGVMLYLLLIKRWSYFAGVFAGYMILVLPWLIRGHNLGGNSYLRALARVNPYRPELGDAGLGDLMLRVWHNVARYTTVEIPSGIFSFITPDYSHVVAADWLFGLLLVSIIAYGFSRLEAGRRRLLLAYLAGTWGILLLWPDVWFGPRFMLPIIPFLIIGFLVGLKSLIDLALKKRNLSWPHVTWLFPMLPLLSFPAIKQLHGQAQSNYPTNWQNYFRIAIWVSQNTDPGTVVSCRKPGMFYYFSGRFSEHFPSTLDDAEMLDHFRERGVDYVVLDQLGFSSTSRYLYPAVSKNPDNFQVVQQLKNPDTFLLTFIP